MDEKAKQRIFDDPDWDHDYPPSHLGEQPFRDASVRLLFGADSDIVREERYARSPLLTDMGTHIAEIDTKKQLPKASPPCKPSAGVELATWALLSCNDSTSPIPTSPSPGNFTCRRKPGVSDRSPRHAACTTLAVEVNHANVFRHNGLEPLFLPYYSSPTHGVDFPSFHTAVSSLPPQSIIVLQVCGNNPTGCDLTLPQWSTLASTILSRNHFVFLDVSYMGFVSGNAETDCAPVRVLAEKGIPLLVAATYGKAFGLYGERVGHLCITAPSQEIKRKMEDQMKLLARAETGAQPRFGARVVSTILTDGQLRRVWETDLWGIAKQLDDRRERLKRHLENLGASGDWSYITEQRGMFL